MYSDISKRISSTPITIASWRVTSVLPTPVGPENRNEPTGFVSSLRPERDILIAAPSASIAASCPKIDNFRSRSSVRNTFLSDVDTLFGGIRAIFAMTFSTIVTVTRSSRSPSGCRRKLAPASSITSIALSGKRRSLICFAASSAAASSASSSYRTP